MLNVAVYVTKTATIIFLLVVFNFDFCASGAVVCIAHGRLMSFSCIHTKQVFCWRWQNSGFSQNLNSFHQHGWLVTGSVASVSCCFVTDWKLRHLCPVPGSIIKLLPDQFCDCIGSLSRLQDYFFISSLSQLWGSTDKQPICSHCDGTPHQILLNVHNCSFSIFTGQEFLLLAFNKYCRNIEDNQKLGSLLYNFILQMAEIQI